MNGSFSLDRFERLVHARQHGAATQELLALLMHLDGYFGELGELGKAESGDAAATQRDARVATRLACAVATLLSDSELRLSDAGFLRLMSAHPWVGVLFGASSLHNADHAIRLFSEPAAGEAQRLAIRPGDLLKFSLLYSLDSEIPLPLEALWQQNRRLTAVLALALLSARFVLTPQAHAKREQLLAWLPDKLVQLSLDELPVDILHLVWMHSSYGMRSDKHLVKKAINALVRRHLVGSGPGDVPAPLPRAGGKPVALCIVEGFASTHPIYRTHSASVESLRGHYHVVGVSIRQASDEASRRVFDEAHLVGIQPGETFLDAVRAVRDLAARLKPALVYYPSVGMYPETVFLANLRLAPLQIAGLGHPATTHSACIDYVAVESDFLGDPRCFSERIIALPPGTMPYRRHPDHALDAAARDAGRSGVVRIAVAASGMKLNPEFLSALGTVARRSAVPVEFWFFASGTLGVAKVYLQNALAAALGNAAVVIPHLAHAAYLQKLGGCHLFANPFPFGNTNGIVDTVSQGLPGVCWSGPEVHSRIDEALFRRLGLPDWLVARSSDEYVAALLRLVENGKERERVAARLRKSRPYTVLSNGDAGLFGDLVRRVHEAHGARPEGRAPQVLDFAAPPSGPAR